MKRLFSLISILCVMLVFSGCNKLENRADTTLKDSEIYIEGVVQSVNGNSLIICDVNGGKYDFTYSDSVQTVVDGYYVVDLTSDSFTGKQVKVICNESIMETFPAQLTGERMIILSDYIDEPEDEADDEAVYHEGHALISLSGDFIFIDEIGSPIVLGKADDALFENITTGDKVKVHYGIVLTTYPGQSSTDECIKLSDGTAEDINPETLSQLREMGWIE